MISPVSSLLLFIPGIFLLLYMVEKSIHKMDTLECILYGSILWNYIFVSLSILIGLFSNLLREFYTMFVILSLFVIVGGSILSLKNIKRLKLTFVLNISTRLLKNFLLISLIFLFLFVNLLLVNYHSIIYEWDAVYYYIPIAKSLITSGHLSNTLRDLNFVEYSPAIPIFYSFILHFNKNLESLYIIPSIFFILTILAIFELARKMGFGYTSLITVLIFLISPSVQIVLGSRSFYLDLPFLFYFITSLLLIIRVKECEKSNGKNIIKILLLLNLTLLFLTRIQASLFILPTLFVAYLLPSNMRAKNELLLAFFALFSVPILRDFRHLIFGGSITLCRLINVYTPYIIAFATFLITYVLMDKQRSFAAVNSSTTMIHKKTLLIRKYLSEFVVWFVIPVPAIMYFTVNNILRGGFIVPGFFISPKLFELYTFYSQLFSSISAKQQACFPCSGILGALTSWWSFTPLLGPISLGLLKAFLSHKFTKKIPTKTARFIWAYLGFFIFWMSVNCDPQPRRMFYLVPLASTIASYGIMSSTDPSWQLANVLYLIAASIIIAHEYVSTAQINEINTNIMHYVYPKTYEVATIDCHTILIFLLVYLLIVGIYFGVKKYRNKNKMFIIANMALLVLFVGIVHPLFSEVYEYGDALKMKLLWYTPYYPEVVDFYKNQSIVDQKTLCFFCHELLTFTGGKFIDLTNPLLYAFKILNKLRETPSPDDFLSYLLSTNTSYVLIPTEQAKRISSIYMPYRVLYNNSVFGNLVRDKIRCEVIGKTTYFYIARLHEKFELHQLNYSEVIPWTYLHEKSFNLTIKDKGEIVFQGYPPKSRPLGVLFRFENPISLDQPITVNLSWQGNISKVLLIVYSDFSNGTTNSLRISYPPEEGTIVVNKFFGVRMGMFNEKHVEAIYIGLMPAMSEGSNESITLNVKGPYLIKYDP